MTPIFVNSSNPGKLKEYQEYFHPREVVAEANDLKEPNDKDPLVVIRYKASQFHNVLVDDVALDIEGADVGLNIRWLLPSLPKFYGKKAEYVCRLAVRVEDAVHLYIGRASGTIVLPRGDTFGFGNYFLPDGTDKTLGEFMDPLYNARSLAVEKFKTGVPDETLPLLETWEGGFQDDRM